jgi:hypothetical protein
LTAGEALTPWGPAPARPSRPKSGGIPRGAMPGFRPGQGGHGRAVGEKQGNFTRMKMHDGEVGIDAGLVGRLVAGQFPRLAGLPVSAVQSTGTVNAIYRLGDHLCTRLPRVQEYAGDLEDELRWLPWLAPQLSLRVPETAARRQSATSMTAGPWSARPTSM